MSTTLKALREAFEITVKKSEHFRDDCPLEKCNAEGEMPWYADEKTNYLWAGFVLGFATARNVLHQRDAEKQNFPGV